MVAEMLFLYLWIFAAKSTFAKLKRVANLENDPNFFCEEQILLFQSLILLLKFFWKMSLQLFLMIDINQLIGSKLFYLQC